jgi:signal-transduction protein with cAMP-binding, CBS, and nucleotidyltransferase domain
MKLVKDVMHQGVHSCRLGCTISEVALKMVKYDVSSLVIVDDEDYMIGIITRTDLVTLRGFQDYWRELTAEHVAIRDVHTIFPEATMRDASRMMSEHRVHRLVVVEAEGSGLRPIGILSQADVVRDMAHQESVSP